MEHTISLASKAFIEAICPTPSRYEKGKSRTAHHGIGSEGEDWDEGDDDDDNEELSWLASLANDTPADAKTEVDENMDFDPGDLLGKLLALINQVLLSCSVLLCGSSSFPDSCLSSSKSLLCYDVSRRGTKAPRINQMDLYSMGINV
jgi:hypothetical protein